MSFLPRLLVAALLVTAYLSLGARAVARTPVVELIPPVVSVAPGG